MQAAKRGLQKLTGFRYGLKGFRLCLFQSGSSPARNRLHEPLSKLFKGGYIGDYIGDYYRVFFGGILGV